MQAKVRNFRTFVNNKCCQDGTTRPAGTSNRNDYSFLKKKQKGRLALNVARRRKELGFKDQHSFADAVGISVSSIKDIERGYSQGSFTTQKTLAAFFRCTVDELYDLPPDQTPHKPASVRDAAPSDTSSKVEALAFSLAGAVLTKLADISDSRREVLLRALFEDSPDILQGLLVNAGHSEISK